MTHLLLVAHAATDWNAERRYQGHTDTPLNPMGRQQAQALGRRLARYVIGRAFTSDLRRASDTATLALAGRIEAQHDRRLRELHFGSWEGLTYSEVHAMAPAVLAAWQADPESVAAPGGENLRQLAGRLDAFRPSIAPTSGDILVVAHRGSLRVLLCLLLGVPIVRHWQFRLEPASLSIVELRQDSATLLRLNDAPFEAVHAG